MATDPGDSVDDDPDVAIDVADVDEFDALLETADRVLVDFYADWCGPCKAMSPTIDALAAEVDDPVAKVDVEALPTVATRYDVKAIPTLVVFEDGTPVERLRGAQEKAVLVDLLEP